VSEPGSAAALRAGLAARLLDHLELLEAHVAVTGGSMLRSGFSVCDLYLGVCCRWMVLYPREDPLPIDWVGRFPALAALLGALEQRSAVVEACAGEWIASPCLLSPSMPEPLEGSVPG